MPRTLRLKGGARNSFIAGNWKLNPTTLDEAKALASAVFAEWLVLYLPSFSCYSLKYLYFQVVKSASSITKDMDICVCCPHPFLAPVSEIVKGTKVSLGAEDLFTEDK